MMMCGNTARPEQIDTGDEGEKVTRGTPGGVFNVGDFYSCKLTNVYKKEGNMHHASTRSSMMEFLCYQDTLSLQDLFGMLGY